MIKVVEITFQCEEEFNALFEVDQALKSHFFQATKVAALVTDYHIEEYTEEARRNRDKVSLMSDMACLTQAMDAYRVMYENDPNKEAQNATPE